MIRSIIFDLDGVLVDTREIHAKAFIAAVKNTKGVTIAPEFHSEHLCGLSTKKKIEKLTQMGIIKNPDTVWAAKQRISEQLIKTLTKTDVCNVLKELSPSYYLCCCSNATMRTVTRSLYYSKLIPFIKRWYSNECVPSIKPDPDMYLKAISESGHKHTETLIIEDSDIGIKAAIASEAYVLRVSSPDCVTVDRIKGRINEIENQYCNTYGGTGVSIY